MYLLIYLINYFFLKKCDIYFYSALLLWTALMYTSSFCFLSIT